MRPSEPDLVEAAGVVRRALAEDLGTAGDVTSIATIPADASGVAELVARGSGVVAGLAFAALAFEAASGGTIRFTALVDDGAAVKSGEVLAEVAGPTRALLTAERTALNLLCRLSGIATLTRRWVDALAGTGVEVLDTRKTTPGLRRLEKYAVRCGGGGNKRMGLADAALVKDNHKLAAGGVAEAYRRVRAAYPELAVQVEVTTVAEARQAVAAGARYLLCDNMSPALLTEVAAAVGDTATLEATGGATLARAREYAGTGVRFVSVGELTHSAPILDIAMDLRSQGGPDAAGH